MRSNQIVQPSQFRSLLSVSALFALALTALGVCGKVSARQADSSARTLNEDVAERARMNAVRLDVQTLRATLLTFEVDTGRYPTMEEGLNALIKNPGVQGWKGPYIEGALPIDPWKHPFQYKNPGTHNPKEFDVFSMGPDGVAGTADDIGNWSSDKK